MDTSKTYIKMCEKAEEIQKRRRLNEGDVIAWRYNADNKNNRFFHLGWSEYTIELIDFGNANKTVKQLTQEDLSETMIGYMYPHLEITWLPRQDQLQEMVRTHQSSYELVKQFYKWLNSSACAHIALMSHREDFSMEQLWLAFVMKEKYNKVWDGENWD